MSTPPPSQQPNENPPHSTLLHNINPLTLVTPHVVNIDPLSLSLSMSFFFLLLLFPTLFTTTAYAYLSPAVCQRNIVRRSFCTAADAASTETPSFQTSWSDPSCTRSSDTRR